MAYKSLDSITRSDIEALGISDDVSYKLLRDLDDIIRNHGSSATPPERWIEISRRILHPDLPFSFHQMMYYGCYKDFGPDPPAWLPDPNVASLTNVGGLLERRGREFLGDDYKDPVSSFSKFQEFSVSNPEVYWRTILDELNILFSVPPKCVLDRDRSGDNPGGNWLPGAYLNPARNCLSSSSKRRSDDDVVIRWRNEGSDDLPVNAMTLLELRSQVWLTAHALNALDLVEESAIAIDMPMNVESVIIYLAIVLAGHVVVSIADSFSPREISTRLKISKAKAIFTQDEIIRGDKSIPLYRRVVDAEAPLAIVIPARGSFVRMNLRENDLSWNEFLGNAGKMRGMEYIAVEKPAGACTNILFSSGTTGEPKAIPWTNISPLKSAADAWCHMDVHQGDVVAWPTNLGWMMGPWLVYASLINGACMALYNGSPPGPAFAKFVQDAEVTMLGVIPSIVRTWQNSNSTSGFDWSRIRCFGSTGEASNVDEYLWLMSRAHYKPVIEYCGGTEIGGSFVTGSLLQPQSLAAFSTAAMGCKLFILGEDCNPLVSKFMPPDAEGVGELALWPHVFGASSSLLNGNHYNVYFKGMPTFQGQILRRHGDLFERTSKGYYRAQGRADDTMNLGGIKVGSVEIERVCNSVDDSVLETAAIGVPPPSGGPEQLVIAVVLKSQELTNRDLNLLKKSFNSEIQKKLNPLFKVSSVVTLPSLPRTATNKVMRRVLRQRLTQAGLNSKL
ncbi:PREDICTED: probable acyl-activating enzyme 17, peroxisomal isoform X1 [Brassica oleracea var. oleracea]|uniref:probable acyl-activating enzyme 17, peroxisomal isoform X1 n=1 Tax=Brassica oleracea var. oleracea TaxID=109376 RepID=UPI0006A6D64C|nr:PREDICTED: probable acyl-activating enzyme 17, peroxisomal isoform X1 [Brassica oleracea var. oleracea]